MSASFYCFSLLWYLILKADAYRGDFMTRERDGYKREDPDSTFNGFFPFWGILLLLLSFLFLLIAGVGLVAYVIGCRSPPERLRQQLDPSTIYS